LAAGLSSDAQDILWVTDQDEIAPNPMKHSHAGHIFHHCLSRYAPTLTGTLVFMTTEGQRSDSLLADAVAITDLAAGTLVDAFGAFEPSTSLWVRPTAALSFKARVIADWFAQSGHQLRRMIVALDQDASGEISVSAFRPTRSTRDQIFFLR
jgi:hypothetical protein